MLRFFKVSVFFVFIMAIIFHANAQLTLQERVNFKKGKHESRWAIDSVTPKERVIAAIEKIAGDLQDKTLTVDSLADYAVFHPDSNQVKEWCNRVLDGGGMSERMLPSIISHQSFDTDGAAISDAVIRTNCRRKVCAFAKTLR